MQLQRKQGIALLVLTGLLIMFVIIANIVWLGSYDPNDFVKFINNPTILDIDAYVRMRAIFTIIGNGLILATFGELFDGALLKVGLV